MASTTLPLCITNIPSSFSNNTNSSFYAKPSPCKLFLHGRHKQSFKVSCNANNTGEHDKNLDAVDRRNVLLGLGGLYGAANLAPLATASPLPPPDLKTCSTAHKSKTTEVKYSCCPPIPNNWDTVPTYNLPRMTKLRTRQPAHAVDEEYIAKYQLATRKMKDLDTKNPSDPRGFKQQANIHCAYCNGAYKFGDKELQVHNSWNFFPFHRWYLYFYERILGSLIDDPTFALPYWNWDHPKGMRLPPMFNCEGTSLYDEKRNPHVRNGTVMDLGFFGDEVHIKDDQLMTNNLTLMYRQMVTNAPCPLLFFGAPYVLGNNVEAPGTIENIPHIPVHIWTGTVRCSTFPDGTSSFGEDMGNFYSAGLDPVFFCHHANVDRMWNEWKTLGGKRRDLVNPDWLNSEYFFYDEHCNPYIVRVQDCLNTQKMGYDYAPMPTLWRNFKPKRKTTAGKLTTSSIPPANEVFPIKKLDKVISFTINRPASSRTQLEKNEKEEMLTFNNIRYDKKKYIRFDVYINGDHQTVGGPLLDTIEYAGSYTSLPQVHPRKDCEDDNPIYLKLAITELLEDNDLEPENTVVVTLVPKQGGDSTSIESAEINLEDC